MSLIDDALKRAQEAGAAAGEARRERPWVAPPMPDAGLARRRRRLRILGLAGLGAAVAAAALTGWIWLAGRSASGPMPPSSRPEAVSPASVPPQAVAADAPAAPPAPSAHAAAEPHRAPASPRPEAPSPAPSSGSAGATSPPAPAAAAPAPPRSSSDAIANGRTYIRSVALGDGRSLELGGIVWNEEQPRALINERILGAGAWVEGFTVVRIEESRIVLEREGVTIYVSLE